MPTRHEAIAAFRDYIGDPSATFDMIEDPKVPGCWAGRLEGDTSNEGFLIQDDPTCIEGSEGVEEVEFNEWPPKSGNLRFFT